jgi:hypothetical protein
MTRVTITYVDGTKTTSDMSDEAARRIELSCLGNPRISDVYCVTL